MTCCAHCGQISPNVRNLFHFGRRISACTGCLPPGHTNSDTIDLCGVGATHSITTIKQCIIVQYTEIQTTASRASTKSDFFALDIPDYFDLEGMSAVEIITLLNTPQDSFQSYHPIQQHAIRRILQFIGIAKPDIPWDLEHNSDILYYQLDSKSRIGSSPGLTRQSLILPKSTRLLCHIIIDRIY